MLEEETKKAEQAAENIKKIRGVFERQAAKAADTEMVEADENKRKEQQDRGDENKRRRLSEEAAAAAKLAAEAAAAAAKAKAAKAGSPAGPLSK